MNNTNIQDWLRKIQEIAEVTLSAYTEDGTKITPNTISASKTVRRLLERTGEFSDIIKFEKKYFAPVFDQKGEIYYLASDLNDVDKTVLKLAQFDLEEQLKGDTVQEDEENYFKALLLDNLLGIDVYNKANRLNVDINKRRIAYLILLEREDPNSIQILNTLFAEEKHTYVIPMEEKSIVVLRSVEQGEGNEEFEDEAKIILAALSEDLLQNIYVTFGNPNSEIRKLSASYKEAKIAMAVGRIFNPTEHVNGFANLGIGRLIYQLPTSVCKAFIHEIFKGESIEEFDYETLNTIEEFFENNLNISEASRKLFIHRNTLVYRLDKVQKLTGLDLRKFDDAITFQIAYLVVKYMRYMESQK